MRQEPSSPPLELPPVEAMDAVPIQSLPAVLAELAALQGRAAVRLCHEGPSA